MKIRITSLWRTPTRKLFATVIMGTLLLSGIFYYGYLARVNFAEEFASYSALALAQAQAAYVPGATDNPVRQELNQVLSQVLGKKMSAADRLQLAHTGLGLIQQSESQIDMIGTAAPAVEVSIARMQVGTLNNFSSSEEKRAIIALAKKRSAIIEDIRGLSYRANFETAKIFNRIITDNGELTPEFIAGLNDDIPEVEQQFNKRSSLYTDLESVSAQIQQKYAERSGIWNSMLSNI